MFNFIKKQYPFIKTFNDFFQGFLFSGVFLFFSRIKWSEILDTVPWLHYVVFPVAAFTDLLKAVFSIIDLAKAKNRNINLWASAIFEITKALLVVTAVVGSFVATAIFGALITPVLFVTAMSLAFVNATVRACINLYNLSKYSKDDPRYAKVRAELKASLIGHLKGIVALSFIIVTLSSILIAHVAAPIAFALGVATAATLFLLTAHSLFKKWQGRKAASKETKIETAVSNDEENNDLDTQKLQSSENINYKEPINSYHHSYTEQVQFIFENVSDPSQTAQAMLMTLIKNRLDADTNNEFLTNMKTRVESVSENTNGSASGSGDERECHLEDQNSASVKPENKSVYSSGHSFFNNRNVERDIEEAVEVFENNYTQQAASLAS